MQIRCYTSIHCTNIGNTKIYKMQNFIVRITQENDRLIYGERIGCFILSAKVGADFAGNFVRKAHEAGKLVLTEGENAAENYRLYQADGLIADVSKEATPQKILKQIMAQVKGAVIGVICRNRRHEAMLVSECEPDFVIFKVWCDGLETNRELLKWYSDLFLIQCAAQVEEDLDYKGLPADFIILDDSYF